MHLIHVGIFAVVAVTISIIAGGCASKPIPPASPATAEDREIKIGEKFGFYSRMLNEERRYWVHLPRSYHSKEFAPQKYPVLYLLDGDANFHMASGVVHFMGAGVNGNIQIPELIIVAIPNTQRTRDLTPTHSTKDYNGKENESLASSGGGESFLRFIEEELIPRIESEYRTQPYRILVGHSFGGLFAINAFVRQPAIFQAFIAIDPSLWWDDQILLRRAKEMASDLKGCVYISLANDPPDEGDVDPQLWKRTSQDFAEFLKANNSAVFRSALQYFESENHGSVPLLSLYHGLLFTFDGYKPTATKLDTISNHFAKVSRQLGFQVLPPEQYVNMLGYYTLYNERDADKAIQWFKMNVSNYPSSSNVYDSLGEAYAAKGEKQLAIEHYEKSLELNPENQNGANALKKLKAK